MIPVKLKLTGFLSYRETVEVPFNGFHLAAISGSNGAGKSTLLDAITWALFGEARSSDEALIANGMTAAEVVFDFEYEGQLYRVQRTKPRGKTGMLEFFIFSEEENRWRPLTEHRQSETQARIKSVLRLDYETFTNASFFLQGKADQFSQQRAADRKRILGSVLGLEVWETYRTETANRRKNEESRLTNLEGQLQEIESELQQESARRERLEKLQAELEQLSTQLRLRESSMENLRRLTSSLEEQRRLVNLLAGQVDAARARADQLTLQRDQREQECEQMRAQIAAAPQIEAEYQAWQASRLELERWEAVAADFRQVDQQRAAPRMAIENERSRLEQELRGLLEQSNQVDARRSQIAQLDEQSTALQEQIDDLDRQSQQRETLQSEMQMLLKTQADAKSENVRLRQEMNELKERIEHLEQVHAAECPLCGQNLSPADRASLIESLKGKGRAQGDAFRQNQAWMRESEQRHKEIQTALDGLKSLDQNLRQLEQRLSQTQARKEQLLDALTVWESGGQLRLDTLQRLLETEDYAHDARAELAGIEATLKELGYDAAEHDRVRRSEQTGRASETRLRKLESARAALAPLEREIGGLNERIQQAEEDMRAQQAAHQVAAEKYSADAANLPDLEQAESELFSLKSRENQLRMQVGGAQQAVEVLKTLKVRQTGLQEKRGAAVQNITRLKTLERAFSKDGVPALLIEQALPQIEMEANEILERLSNGMMSVRFDTQRDYKDKNRSDKRETLAIVISDTSGEREYEMYSGGEAFRVNFAIRLALARVLSQRAGARLQTLVIDEGFGSQDAEGRQRLIEAINMVQNDFAKVLVITHLEELKDAFPARIEVEKGPTGSKVRVVAQ